MDPNNLYLATLREKAQIPAQTWVPKLPTFWRKEEKNLCTKEFSAQKIKWAKMT